MPQALKDFSAGVCSGWTQVLISQPFQILKVRLQTQDSKNPEYTGILDCLRKTVNQQGLMALYKGTLSPLIGCGFQVSLLFGLNQFCKRFFGRFKTNPQDNLPLHLVAASGMVAGVGSGFAATPIEHARIRIQIQKDETKRVYQGSIDAVKKIVSQHGMRGLFLGLGPTLCREIIGSMLYFTGYEWMMRKFLKKGQRVTEAPLHASLVSGGFAGLSFWTVAYPVDLIKTKMQTDNLCTRKYPNMVTTIQKILEEGGVKGFYKGYGVCILRAIPVNSGGFLVFEAMMRLLGRSAQSL